MGRQSNYEYVAEPGSCPKCEGKLGVIDSRKTKEYTRRRIECKECGHRFSTAEIHMETYERLKRKEELIDKILHEVALMELNVGSLDELKKGELNTNGK